MTELPPKKARFDYVNHRGEWAVRTVIPERIWYGLSDYYPCRPGWFLRALDVEKNEIRDFAIVRISEWGDL